MRYAAKMLPDLLLGETQRVESFRNMLSYLFLSLDENPTPSAPPLSNVYLVAQGTQISLLIYTSS